MTILEKKVDALIHFCLAENPYEQTRCKHKLQELLSGKRVVGTVREETTALLTELGMPANMLGHALVLEAICIAVEKPELAKHGMISTLRRKVAQIHDTTADRVERNIRNAVERCLMNCPEDLIFQHFGSTISADKMTLSTGKFISECTRIIRARMKTQ